MINTLRDNDKNEADKENSDSLKNRFYNLHEIAEWQLADTQLVKLPELQRGFVWNPSQIETLWDSVLRGFPIGSFLMTQSGKDLLLIDGQQRSTSIAYGFYNPWSEKQTSFFDKKNKDAKHIPVLWMDLDPKEKVTNSHKYLLKIVTRSHPWGYKSMNNRETLAMADRRKAMELLKKNPLNVGIDKYTDFDNRTYFPIKTDTPIPLSFLLDALFKHSDLRLVRDHIFSDVKKLEISNFPTIDNISYMDRLTQKLYSEEFAHMVASLKKILFYQVPAIVTSHAVIQDNDNSEENGSSDPTLFVRLNSLGTRISGEELIYSIFKAEFPLLKNAVEEIGSRFIQPSKLVSIIIRKCLTDLDNNKFKNSLTVNDFRKKLKDDNFKLKLQKVINNRVIADYFENILGVLNAQDSLVVPKILIKYLINNNIEIFTLLLLSIKNQQLSAEQILQTKKTFIKACWFTLDSKNFVKENWKTALESDSFWTDANWKCLEVESRFIAPLFSPRNLLSFLNDQTAKKISYNNWYPSSYSEFYSNEILERKNNLAGYWDKVLNTLVWNRDVLIFVQRDYFNENFAEYNSLDVLTSTNRPWDWDHIYPSSYVYNRKKNIDARIRNLYNQNCNLRALSYDVNRSESDSLLPAQRFNDQASQKKFFIKNNDFSFWSTIKDQVKRDDEVENLLSAFKHRMFNIYEEIYRSLT